MSEFADCDFIFRRHVIDNDLDVKFSRELLLVLFDIVSAMTAIFIKIECFFLPIERIALNEPLFSNTVRNVHHKISFYDGLTARQPKSHCLEHFKVELFEQLIPNFLR